MPSTTPAVATPLATTPQVHAEAGRVNVATNATRAHTPRIASAMPPSRLWASLSGPMLTPRWSSEKSRNVAATAASSARKRVIWGRLVIHYTVADGDGPVMRPEAGVAVLRRAYPMYAQQLRSPLAPQLTKGRGRVAAVSSRSLRTRCRSVHRARAPREGCEEDGRWQKR